MQFVVWSMFVVGAVVMLSALIPLWGLRLVPDDYLMSAALRVLISGAVRLVVGSGLIKLSQFLAAKYVGGLL